MVKPRQILQLLCTGLWMALAGTACAQSAAGYPNKPVRIILPYAPGGANDPVAALFTDRFNREWGQPFLMDNRAGGDTIIGTAAVAKAVPDGYTLLMHSSAVLVNHSLYPDLQFNTLKDLVPIATLMRSESVMLLHPSVPANDLKEFIGYVRANPGRINAASSSPLVVLHYQRFMNATGTRLTIVPYKGGGPIMTDLLAGTVQVSMTAASSVPALIKSGKVRGLAISGGKRSAALPELPTFAEAGVKDYDPNNWLALFAPAKTPRDIIEKLNAQVRKTLADPEVVSALVKMGFEPNSMTLAQVEQFIGTEADRFGRLIKEAGLKAEQ